MWRRSRVYPEIRERLHVSHVSTSSKRNCKAQEQSCWNLKRPVFENCVSDLSQGHPGFRLGLRDELGWTSKGDTPGKGGHVGQETGRKAYPPRSSLITTGGEEDRNGKQTWGAAGKQGARQEAQFCSVWGHTVHGKWELLPILCTRDPYHQPGTFRGPFTSL